MPKGNRKPFYLGNVCVFTALALHFSKGYSLVVWTLYCKILCWSDNLVRLANKVWVDWSYCCHLAVQTLSRHGANIRTNESCYI